MSKFNKKSYSERVEIQYKPARIGHQEHLSGSGKMDNRPKRERTRQAMKKSWEKDYE